MAARRTPPSKFYPGLSSSNPFDSDSESAPVFKPSSVAPASASASYYSSRNKYRNNFQDSGGVENQSVQELESYAAYKAEDTTKKVNDCLKIAEGIREDASKTLVTLHQQGEQISRTHMTAANIEHDLSRSEKLLGSLGGFFSKNWKPKKSRDIKGPILTRDDSFIRRSNHTEQRQRLGLSSSPIRSRSASEQQYLSEPTSAMDKVQVEKAKQDDALTDLSNLLGDLKNMAVDMGSEIERQNKAMDHMQDDVDELNFRVRGANMRGRRLIGK